MSTRNKGFRETLDDNLDDEERESQTVRNVSRAKPATTASSGSVDKLASGKQPATSKTEFERRFGQTFSNPKSAEQMTVASSKTVSSKPSNSAGESRVEARPVDYTRFISSFARSSLRDVSTSYQEVVLVDDNDDESDTELRP